MDETRIKPHSSFWIICIIALIWNIMGSGNFIMQTNPEMLANYPEAAQSLITSRPQWSTIAFAIAVFGGVAVDILPLMKKSVAYYLLYNITSRCHHYKYSYI